MKMYIYDTKQRRKVTFSPEKDNTVRMYTCGPTIYNFAHIGNLRTFVFEDLLRRTIKFLGMKVFHVMNLTDVDDKTIAGAIENKQTLLEFTKPFEIAFHQDLQTLGVEPAEKYPKPTEFVDQMIVMIEKLIDKVEDQRDGIITLRDDNIKIYTNGTYSSYVTGPGSYIISFDIQDRAKNSVPEDLEINVLVTL